MKTFFLASYVLWAALALLPGMVQAQEKFTGSNECSIRIGTSLREYEFTSKEMNARLNDAMNRFEFEIPLGSFKSQGDTSDTGYLKRLANGGDYIIIHASLPEKDGPAIDLSYFKGNGPTNLDGQIEIGKFVFEDDVDFAGMLMGGDQSMAFNLNVFQNERQLSFMQTGPERILEIEIEAKGDKILGLTSN